MPATPAAGSVGDIAGEGRHSSCQPRFPADLPAGRPAPGAEDSAAAGPSQSLKGGRGTGRARAATTWHRQRARARPRTTAGMARHLLGWGGAPRGETADGGGDIVGGVVGRVGLTFRDHSQIIVK